MKHVSGNKHLEGGDIKGERYYFIDIYLFV